VAIFSIGFGFRALVLASSCISIELFSAVRFVIVIQCLSNNFYQFWVRKLTGKPEALTPPDCEFEARRIQMIMEHFYRPLPPKATISR
jgi:hypothetical protein